MSIRPALATIFSLLLTACASEPENFQGKRFDANTSYCKQMRDQATLLLQDRPISPVIEGREHNPALHSLQAVSLTEMAIARMAYESDCESMTAYNARTAPLFD